MNSTGFGLTRVMLFIVFCNSADHSDCWSGCIDKTSSAELSEAINSMYRWYRKARVCYAYLDDISPNDISSTKATGWDDYDPWEVLISAEVLGKARWFTRGWTLQELIAPSQIRFYAADWTFFGNKANLGMILQGITGIDAYILQSTVPKLERVSVAKRMSWAAKRTTTRTEDLAYSLMFVASSTNLKHTLTLIYCRGLFGVNMPLLYGEGEKAFTRLQEEILKDNEDQTLFAWVPSPNRPTLFEYHGQHVTMGVSIFAEHPREFAQAADFLPLVPQGDPPAVTNKGIRINLPVVRLSKSPDSISGDDGAAPLFFVVLYCTYGKTQRLAGIVVRRLRADGQSHTYVRHDTAEVLSVHLEDIFRSDTRQLYLRRRPQELSQREQWSLGPGEESHFK